jgi:hypothetical protein
MVAADHRDVVVQERGALPAHIAGRNPIKKAWTIASKYRPRNRLCIDNVWRRRVGFLCIWFAQQIFMQMMTRPMLTIYGFSAALITVKPCPQTSEGL